MPTIGITMFVWIGPRSFKNVTAATRIFERECAKVDSSRLMVACCDDPLNNSMIKKNFLFKTITHNKADCHSGMAIPQYATNPCINLIDNIMSLTELYASIMINQSLYLCSGI